MNIKLFRQKDFEVLLRRKMDSSVALWGRRRDKDKKNT